MKPNEPHPPMTERGHFMHPAEDGTIMVSFEKAGGAVPIESLLPENGRGEGFADFGVRDYFGLADLVLAEPKEFAEFCRNVNLDGHTKDNPKRVVPPPPNMTYLKLRRGKGLHAERIAELFTIVAAYWQAKPKTMALKPGLVAGLWHGGMSAADIIRYIKDFTDEDGELYEPAGRGPDIMNAVFSTYRRINNLPDGAIAPMSHVTQMVDVWMQATRSALPGTPEFKNTALHWADYRQLGLVDTAGRANIDRVIELAERVFGPNPIITFHEALAYAEARWMAQTIASSIPHKSAHALLKKKRKQGKLNRKRGRR